MDYKQELISQAMDSNRFTAELLEEFSGKASLMESIVVNMLLEKTANLRFELEAFYKALEEENDSN